MKSLLVVNLLIVLAIALCAVIGSQYINLSYKTVLITAKVLIFVGNFLWFRGKANVCGFDDPFVQFKVHINNPFRWESVSPKLLGLTKF